MDKEEVRENFKRAIFILNSIELQNKIIAELPYMSEKFLPDFAKKRMAMGDVDEWTNANGEFGRTPTNPILVNNTWGEVTYLSRLITNNNKRMIFHRIGSIVDAIDAFELVSEDAEFVDVLYLDMYHKNCSKKAPTGYKLLEIVDGITGTSETIPGFPMNILEPLVKTAVNKFGAPIVNPLLFDFDEKKAAKLLDEARRGTDLKRKILSTTTV